MLSGYFDTLKYRPEHSLSYIELAYFCLAYGTWAFATVIIFYALERILSRAGILQYVLFYIFAMLVWLPTYFTLDFAIAAWLYDKPINGIAETLINTPNGLFFLYGILYSLTFGICTSILYFQRSQLAQLSTLELQAQNNEAKLTMANQQLQLLQSQLGPHFMFNCLGSISALARTGDKETLISAVANVGNLLRFTIESSGQKYVLLSEEIGFIQDYIDLQKLRFEQRFSFTIQQTQQADVFVPPFLIHPLIENAFVHAIARTNQPVNLNLLIETQDDRLMVSVTNDYVESEVQGESLGSAINNLKNRLQMLFNNNYRLSHARRGNEYLSQLTIPQVTSA